MGVGKEAAGLRLSLCIALRCVSGEDLLDQKRKQRKNVVEYKAGRDPLLISIPFPFPLFLFVCALTPRLLALFDRM